MEEYEIKVDSEEELEVINSGLDGLYGSGVGSDGDIWLLGDVKDGFQAEARRIGGHNN